MPIDNNDKAPIDPKRRKFLKSVLGLGSVMEREASAKTKSPVKQDDRFFWADFSMGNIGFPTGLDVPNGRPGSIMKLIASAALLEEGALNPNETIECTGFHQSKWSKYKCPKEHGGLEIEEAIAISCNVYFAKVSSRLGSETILGYARKFGLDQPISGQPSGAFPREIDDDSVSYALGLNKGLRPSALQLMRVAALIGKDGEIPFLRSADMRDLKGNPYKLDLKRETFNRLKKGMRMAAQEGTARGVDPGDKLKLAVKTGTVSHGNKFQSWIIGYFPYDNPSYAFSLFAPVGTSHDSAVPLAKRRLSAVEWP